MNLFTKLFLKSCAVYGLLVLLCMQFISIRIITSSSMERTLSEGDVILLLKRAWIKEIKRGDVLVLKEIGNDTGRSYIKRCIGIPNDSIVIFGDKVSVNSEILTDQKGIQYMYSFGVETGLQSIKLESLSEIWVSKIIFTRNEGRYLISLTHKEKKKFEEQFPHAKLTAFISIRDFHENKESHCNDSLFCIKIDDGSYFLMGDNRSLSLDSRHYGPVNMTAIQGKYLFKIWG